MVDEAERTDERTVEQKLADLREVVAGLGSVAVALSGGVDSTLLAKVSHDVLGDAMVAMTAETHTTPHQDVEETERFCADEGIRQVVLRYNELDIPGFADNPTNRCYLCKRELFTQMAAACQERGIARVAEGSNLDDEGDFRPGLMAVSELHVASPLREARLHKQDVRDVSHLLGLRTWDKPAAACLSSRFPYWHKITVEKLEAIDYAEDYLRSLGFAQCRVRVHEDVARIEVEPGEVARLASPGVASRVTARLHGLGFTYVTVDLDGFRSGSMNAKITESAT